MPSTLPSHSPGIVLLHLSDLHFGNKNRFKERDLNEFGTEFSQAIQNELAELKWGCPIDLLVVSGDIAEVAKPSEFEQGRVFLTALIEGLKLAPSRTIFIPGNHDFNWSECKKVDADRETYEFDNADYQKRLNEVKFRFYTDFLQNFYNSAVEGLLGRTLLHKELGAYLCDFTIEGRAISFAALNTSENETHIAHGGELSKAQASALMKAWTLPEYAESVKIALVHHNPTASPPENIQWTEEWLKGKIAQNKLDVTPDWLAHYTADMAGFKNAEFLKHIVHDTDTHLVLHGHHHNPTSPTLWKRKTTGATPILSVGSFGLNADQIPTNQPLTCQLIYFQTEPQPRLYAVPLEYDAMHRLEGTLNKGQYRLNVCSEAAYEDTVALPKSWTVRVESKPEAKQVRLADAPSPNLIHFLTYYRNHLAYLHSSYDLKNLGVLPAEMHKTAAPQLDDLYLPLRFDAKFNINETEQGSILDVDALLTLLTRKRKPSRSKKRAAIPIVANASARKQSLAITGNAGAGKTTWIRYTFRRMRSDPRTLPFLIELRSVAKFWQEENAARHPRSIEAYLEHWLTENAPDYKDAGVKLPELLNPSANCFPVLLVDGWDELGGLGVEFRDKLLGMMEHYPCLLVIATSRPYGEARPSNSDGFLQLQVQPLNVQEIDTFARNFYEKCYQEEKPLADKQATTFQNALARSEDAKLLAKTPLLLTMMLFINRSKRLPDKRHQLYEECLMSLLSERPGMQMDAGALLLTGQWCPSENGRERFQIVARMAHDLQTKHTPQQSTANVAAPIAVSKATLRKYLPVEWSVREKNGFLLWLCGRAGIMVDNTEDNIWFAHLSFQEFMTAWHLNNNYVGDDAPARFAELVANPLWWETLLLWAALLNDQSQERAEKLLQTMLENGHVLLVGMMLADGVGTDTMMDSWAGMFASLLCQRWPQQAERCARIWQASRQEVRRDKLISVLHNTAAEADWLAWLRFSQFLEQVGDRTQPRINYPESARQAPAAALSNLAPSGTIISAKQFAGGRVLSGIHSLWPGYPEGLLHLWPSERRRITLDLQRLASINVNRAILSVFLGEMPQQQPFRSARACALDLDLALDRDRYRAFARALALARDLDRVLDHNLAHNLNRDLTRALDFALNLDLGLAFTRVFDLAYEQEASNFQLVNIMARYFLGTSTLRTSLCLLVVPPSHHSNKTLFPLYLITVAARVSVGIQTASEELAEAIALAKRSGIDTFWIAFARHIALLSTAEDHALLKDLAAHPEKREPPLSWALQYIVRGDILLPDGSEVTLDELCAEAGVPPYPLLEDMPPELEWEDEESARKSE